MKRAAEGDVPRRQRKISGVAFDTSIAENVPSMDGNNDDLNELTAGMNDVEIADVNRVPLKSKGRKSRSVSQRMATSSLVHLIQALHLIQLHLVPLFLLEVSKLINVPSITSANATRW